MMLFSFKILLGFRIEHHIFRAKLSKLIVSTRQIISISIQFIDDIVKKYLLHVILMNNRFKK